VDFHDLQLPSSYLRKPSSCYTCQKHLKKGNRFLLKVVF
jgi:hypothetical protein